MDEIEQGLTAVVKAMSQHANDVHDFEIQRVGCHVIVMLLLQVPNAQPARPLAHGMLDDVILVMGKASRNRKFPNRSELRCPLSQAFQFISSQTVPVEGIEVVLNVMNNNRNSSTVQSSGCCALPTLLERHAGAIPDGMKRRISNMTTRSFRNGKLTNEGQMDFVRVLVRLELLDDILRAIQELNSRQIGNTQDVVSEARRFVDDTFRNHPELVASRQNRYTNAFGVQCWDKVVRTRLDSRRGSRRRP